VLKTSGQEILEFESTGQVDNEVVTRAKEFVIYVDA
jgi:hypothetical protein